MIDERLRPAGKLASYADRIALAARPDLSPFEMHSLSSDVSPAVRSTLATNPIVLEGVSAPVRKTLLLDTDESVRAALATMRISKRLQQHLFKDKSLKVRLALASNPDLFEDIAESLASTNILELRMRMLSNPALPADIARARMTSLDFTTRSALWSNPALPADVREHLAEEFG